MTQEVLKMALEALETYKGFIDNAHIIEGQWHWIDGLDNVQTAIQKAMQENAMREVQRLGQEIEQEPVGRFTGKFTVDAHDRMLCEVVCTGAIPTAGAALYTTPPQRTEQDHIPDARKMVTEQEPVAHCEAGPEYCPVCNTELNQEPAIYPEEAYEMGLEEIAFYTAPPQRTWVGLTDEEILHRIDTHVGVPSQKYPLDISDLISFARAIEAKLKEKNT